MGYVSEDLIRQLGRVRREAGLSQRQLSQLSGLTQSQISNIERGSQEPGLSNLIDLTRALDRELVLVPRKLLPAVQAIVEAQASKTTRAPPSQAIEINKFDRLVKKQKALYGSSAALDQIADSLHLLRFLPLTQDDRDIIRVQYRMLSHHTASKQAEAIIREIANKLRAIRNRLAHRVADDTPRPAYSLDDEEDDA